MKIRGVLILVILVSTTLAHGQSVVSPYSILGVGDFAFSGLTHHQAMGETGVGSPTRWHVNHLNPAWLYRNAFSTFQVAMSGEIRRFSTLEANGGNSTAGLGFISISLPVISNRWTTNFGLLPYTTVNYDINTRSVVEGTSTIANKNLNGNGGLSQIFFSNGFRISKNFGVGVQAKYLFGTIANGNSVTLDDPNLFAGFQSTFIRNTSYSDISVLGGISYLGNLKNNRFISLGATYELNTGLDGLQEEAIERTSITTGVVTDSEILFSDREVNFVIPENISLGLGFGKVNAYAINLDFSYRPWKEEGGFENGAEEFTNSFKIALGGEYIPDYTDVNKYFRRVSYRAGFTLERLPYLVNQREINDFGINFGTSLPVRGGSSLDLAVKIGQRGSVENDLIRETYFRFVFGATINDRWFIRRKYN